MFVLPVFTDYYMYGRENFLFHISSIFSSNSNEWSTTSFLIKAGYWAIRQGYWKILQEYFKLLQEYCLFLISLDTSVMLDTQSQRNALKKHGRYMEEKTFSSIFKLPVNNKCLRDLWKMEEKILIKWRRDMYHWHAEKSRINHSAHHLTGRVTDSRESDGG